MANATVPHASDGVRQAPHQRAYSIPDAARILSVSPSHLWALVAAGRLRTFQLGRRRLIAAAEIERVLNDGL